MTSITLTSYLWDDLVMLPSNADTIKNYKVATDTQDDKRSYSSAFKAKVVLAALKEEKSISELAMEFAVTSDNIANWRQQLLLNIHTVFENNVDEEKSREITATKKHANIGQLMAENDFLTKVLGR